MGGHCEQSVGTIAQLSRYPVKSMVGEVCTRLEVTARGIVGDRGWAVLDEATGKVASAKQPKFWRSLLGCRARTLDGEELGVEGGVEITLPNGTIRRAGEPELDDLLSTLTGRPVRLSATPPPKAHLDRSHPEAVLAAGLDADVASDILEIGASAPPATFFDYSAIHLITTATLDALSAMMPGGAIEPERYRANVVLRSPTGMSSFPENEWIGGHVRIGAAVELRVVLQTPRCAIPTLAHGRLPPRPEALRAAADLNRLELPGFGSQACAGIYAEVVSEGIVSVGDHVVFVPNNGTSGSGRGL